MPRKRGRVLGDRDRQIMRWLGDVGPMSCRQLWDLEGRRGEERNLNRRLRKLCEQRGPVPPHLVTYSLPRSGIEPLFALTHHGADQVGLRDEAPMPHMSWTEIRHQMQTAAVFTGLVAAQKDPARTNFIWRADRGMQWTFRGCKAGSIGDESMAIRPDVIVESKTHAIRMMIEIETGSHPIRRRSGSVGKSILDKVHRYAAFFSEWSLDHQPIRTWYQAQFGDERHPVLLVVTTSFRRSNHVAEVISRDPLVASRSNQKWRWMVMATDEAGVQLERLMNGLEPLATHAVRERLGLSDRRLELAPVSIPVAMNASVRPSADGATTPAPGGDRSSASLAFDDALQLRADLRTMANYVNECRAQLSKLIPALPPEEALRVKALFEKAKSEPLFEAHARMRDILERMGCSRK